MHTPHVQSENRKFTGYPEWWRLQLISLIDSIFSMISPCGMTVSRFSTPFSLLKKWNRFSQKQLKYSLEGNWPCSANTETLFLGGRCETGPQWIVFSSPGCPEHLSVIQSCRPRGPGKSRQLSWPLLLSRSLTCIERYRKWMGLQERTDQNY